MMKDYHLPGRLAMVLVIFFLVLQYYGTPLWSNRYGSSFPTKVYDNMDTEGYYHGW
jgi:hypothetical protein